MKHFGHHCHSSTSCWLLHSSALTYCSFRPHHTIFQSGQEPGLLCLLLQLATHRQHFRNPCPTFSSEWAAAGGGRDEKSMLLPGPEDNAKQGRNEQRPSANEWRNWGGGEVGAENVQHLWCHANKLQQPGMKCFVPISHSRI